MDTNIYTISDIKQLLKEILNDTDVDKAILFGSYAKNTQDVSSDIDIVIDSNGKVKGLKFYALIDIIKEAFNKEVDIIERAEIDDGSKIAKEIEKTGVVVYEK